MLLVIKSQTKPSMESYAQRRRDRFVNARFSYLCTMEWAQLICADLCVHILYEYLMHKYIFLVQTQFRK